MRKRYQDIAVLGQPSKYAQLSCEPTKGNFKARLVLSVTSISIPKIYKGGGRFFAPF